MRSTEGRRRRWPSLTFVLVGVAGLLLLAPISQAAAGGPPMVILKAPFTGVTTYPSTSTSSAGCGTGKVVRAPFFIPTTGKGGFSEKAHATSCPGLYGDSGSASAGLTVSVPIPAHSGTNVIHARWTVDASVGAQIGGANCLLYNTSYSYCYLGSYSSLSGYAYLIDVTNNSYWFGTTAWPGVYASSSLFASCYFGNCSLNVTGNQHFSVKTTVTWSFHANGLNPSHVYVLEVDWYSGVSVFDYSYQATLTGASEAGSVIMSGPGSGATLNWITIS